ncbi:response regulator [Leptolyngbya cf. ectocarpi LEGE 11479]|uniref:histidine kinase n=1 Tax=Leptolyngbya cf. ectocarpi LEGE 11479 TaxID=1828722 RepID=A0A928ZW25_LEPEC|nr:response regulator [Leptolyngbya ectocarpi]MBE9068517.1 response regulator [Leptolyngbya cf. ectocarpi LEGE 11479]
MQPSNKQAQLWKTTWLPIIVGTGIIAATLALWQSLRVQAETQIHRQVDFATVSISREIRSQTDNRIQALVRMSRRWAAQGGMSEPDWTIDAESLLHDYPGYQAIGWIDTNFYIRWIVPTEGNEAAQDLNLAADPNRKAALEFARTNRIVGVSAATDLVQGGQGVLVYSPIFLAADQSFDGFILGVFRVQHLFETILHEQVAPDYAIAIRENGTEIYRRMPADPAPANLQTRWSQHTEIDLYGTIWQIEVWPTAALLAQEKSPLPGVILIGGLLLSGLAAWVVWLTQKSQQRQSQLVTETTERKATEAHLRQFSSHLKHLHRINTTHYETFDQLFADCLETGCQILGLETGIISQINDQTYMIRSVQSNLTSLAADQVFTLADTYCAAVVKEHQTITYKHVGNMDAMKGHPVYRMLHLETYLGTPIWVNGEIYGTLNFSSTQIRHQGFSLHEQEIIELMAQSIGRFLAADLAQQQQQTIEAALRESEARFRTVANSAPVLLWMTGTDHLYTFFNQTWLTFTGRQLDQELNNGWTEGIHPDDHDYCLKTHTTAFEEHRTFELEYRLRRADGQYRWVLSRGVPRFRANGSFAGYIGTCIDISDRHEVEKLKDEFISVVNHELRTPLTSILGSLDLLASGVLNTKPEKGQRMLQIAAKNADRLVRLINDMLDIERIESGKMTLNRQVCDGGELMTTAADEIRTLATQAGIQLAVTPLPVKIWADSDRIIQVFTNLLSNAIKFSPQGATVELTATLQDSHPTSSDTSLPVSAQQVQFQVRDHGRGIPLDKLKTIFGRFQQVDASDSRKRGGTGLGLAVCRSIVQHHGGGIWVESIPDQGSTFFVSLPVLPPPTSLPASNTSPPLILVCDDDSSVRTVIETMLEQQDYRVITVSSGQAAVAQATAQKPDVILLNLLMPGMSGGETLAALKARSQTRDIPVIILSGLSPEEGDTLHSEISNWIIKPPDEAVLFQALQQALVSSRKDIQVLIVEDDLDLVQVLTAIFERHGITPHHASTGQAGIYLSQKVLPDLLVLDLALPESNGYAVVDWLRQHNQLCRVPLVIYTAKDLDDSERQRLHLGQTLFLTKGRVAPDEFEKQVMQLINRVTHPVK